MRHFFTFCFCLIITILCIGILNAPDFVEAAPITENPNAQYTCEERTDTLHDTSAPLRSLPVAAAIQPPPSIIFLPPYKLTSPPPSNFRTVDPARQSLLPSESMPAPILSFDGISRVSAPEHPIKPDTNGDVGPNHYVQSTNRTLDFYGKSGNHLYGPITDRTLFAGFATFNVSCDRANADPIVLYDAMADRWVVSYMLENSAYECVAVSTGPDPLGSYHRYLFNFGSSSQLPNVEIDYPKLAVWTNGYFMSVDYRNTNGASAIALQRDEMLAGRPAKFQRCHVPDGDATGGRSRTSTLLPSDIEGAALATNLPPDNYPPLYASLGPIDGSSGVRSTLKLYRFYVNWNDVSNTLFTDLTQPERSSYNPGFCLDNQSQRVTTCVPQPSNAPYLDTKGDRLMHRLVYRRLNTGTSGGKPVYEDRVLLNHTVDLGLDDYRMGVRWLELSEIFAIPTVRQESSFADNAASKADSRWMASIAMDHRGNIGLGFNASGLNTYPSVQYTGRESGDSLGVLRLPKSFVTGGGAQQIFPGVWGDYSMMAVDPVNDCTFWYTNEYYASTSQNDWNTRIGTFRFPSCQDATCAVRFVDVASSNTFYPYVQCLACRGIMGGYPCGGTNPPEPCNATNDPYYRPGSNITRGQLAKIVAGAAFLSDSVSGTQTYADVSPGSPQHPFYKWIEQLTRRGAITGYPCGGSGEPCDAQNRKYFRPYNLVTRGQTAKVVAITANFTDTPSGQTFEDVPSSGPFYLWVEQLASRQVMGGYPCGGPGEPCRTGNKPYFRPSNSITRGQAAKIISNTFFPNCVVPGLAPISSPAGTNPLVEAPEAPKAVPSAPAALASSQATLPPAPTSPPTADPNPHGNHDNTTSDKVEGWACDPSNFAKPVAVHIYDGWGFEPNYGNFLGAVMAGRPREQGVANSCGGYANHGFSFTLPQYRRDGKVLKDGGVHTIVAHIIGIDAQGSSNGRVVQALNTGHLELLGSPRNGLLGEYFSGTGLTPLAYRGYDADVNYNWYHASPDASLPVDSYSVRWTGYIKTPDGVSGNYTFFTVSDDGVRLWVNGQLLVNNWTNHAPTENSKVISLQGGQVYSIKLEYYEAGGTALIQMLWQPPNGAKEIIPSSRLLPVSEPASTYGLKGEYFNGKTLTDLRLTRYDNNVDYDWGNWYPDPVLPVDAFSARWTGSLRIPAGAGGSYRFYTVADDGVRLWVNGQLIISDWTTHAPVENMSSLIPLDGGKTYDIKLEYYEDWGGAMVQLLWQPPGGVKAIIPSTNLYPGPTCQAVSWASLVNVTATGNSIKKTSGGEWVWDASSVSLQQFPSGDGYVQVTLNGNDPSRKHFGLGIGNSSVSYDDIDFSFAVQNDAVWIWENNQEKKTLGNKPIGTKLKVAVESGVVKYYVNSTLVYTSLKAPSYPLILDTSIANLNGQITEATICMNAAVTTAGGSVLNAMSSINDVGDLDDVYGLKGILPGAIDAKNSLGINAQASNGTSDMLVHSQVVTGTVPPVTVTGTGTPTTKYDHKGKPGYVNPASLNSERGFRKDKDKDKDKDVAVTVSPSADVSLTATSVAGDTVVPGSGTVTAVPTMTPGRAAITTTATPTPEVTATPNVTVNITNPTDTAGASNTGYQHTGVPYPIRAEEQQPEVEQADVVLEQGYGTCYAAQG